MMEVGCLLLAVHQIFCIWHVDFALGILLHDSSIMCLKFKSSVISGFTIFEISMQRKGRGSSVMLVLSWKMVQCGGPSLLVLQEHKSVKLFSTHH